MRKMIQRAAFVLSASIAFGLASTTASWAVCTAGQNFSTEGPDYPCQDNDKKRPARVAGIPCKAEVYSEGIDYKCNDPENGSVLGTSEIPLVADLYTEGPDSGRPAITEIIIRFKENAVKVSPAAGN